MNNRDDSWRSEAACFAHPLAKEGAWDFEHTEFRDLALDVCSSCPVRRACYDDALHDAGSEGIRGGVLFKIRPYTKVAKDPAYGAPKYEESVSELRNE